MLKAIISSTAAVSVAAGLFMWKEAFRNDVKSTTIQDETFPRKAPLALFFISDIHRRLVSRSIIQKAGRADAVIVGGDLLEEGVKKTRIVKNIQRLAHIGPVYFIPGNNDYEMEWEELEALLTEQGVVILRNGAAALHHCVYLAGVDDLGKQRADKKRTLQHVPAHAYTIFCAHNPAFIKHIQPEDNVALFLSGHTHGGQIRFGRFGLYEKGGWKKRGDMPVLVSNGYGTTGIPLRLGARAETHKIIIQRPGL